MRKMSKPVMAMIVAAPMLLLAGCATQADLDALRSDVMKSEQSAAEAAAEARKAAQEASRAANAATAASDKADRIFRESLRKQ